MSIKQQPNYQEFALAPFSVHHHHKKVETSERIPSIHHLLYSLPEPSKNSFTDYTLPLSNPNHLKYYQEFAQGYIPTER